MSLLAVSHWKQRRQADCLVACAAMILEYLQVPVNYDRLTRLLRTMPIGTFFRNLRYLEAGLGLSVTVGYGNLQVLEAHLEPVDHSDSAIKRHHLPSQNSML